MIKLENIKKSFGKQTVLKNISLHIHKGEMVAIMGKSGSGKSTLLNIIGRQICFDSGSYMFKNQAYNNIPILSFRKYNVAYIGQKPIVLSDRNIYDNIRLGIDLYQLKEEDKIKRIDDICMNLNIGDLLKKRADEISGGEAQKITIARALVYKKPLILADEPTGSLDSGSAKEVMDIFKQFNNSGSTILLVTHDADIAKCCSRTIRIKDGTIE